MKLNKDPALRLKENIVKIIKRELEYLSSPIKCF